MSEYFGEFDESNKKNNVAFDIIKTASTASELPCMMLFWSKYNVYPRTMESPTNLSLILSYSMLLKLLKEKYNHETDNDIIKYIYDTTRDKSYVSSLVIELANGVIVHFYGGSFSYCIDESFEPDFIHQGQHLHQYFQRFKVFFLPGKEHFVEQFISEFKYLKIKKPVPETVLKMICHNECQGLYLTPIKIKKPLIKDLKLHYGDEFEKVHNTIMKSLSKDSSSGLILLHGLPGSGKTHYIRLLIQEITEKQMIYVPPDMTESIASPEFFPFMLKNSNSVLIIEDAENIIKSRDSKETTTQAVANLLNLSDGLLGDSLNQIIIATFNCDLKSIDTALLRKGRLIAQHEFGKLTIESAQKLSNQLGFTTAIKESMTLADIYGQDQ